jgi:anti-anti-sigma regulatory factor
MEDALFARLADEPDVKRVVLNCSGLGRIDLTGAYSLAEMVEQVRLAGLEMEIVHVPEQTRRILEAAGVGTEGPSAS